MDYKNKEQGNSGWAVLGFFFPLVGFILWLVWNNTNPGDARMAGKGALWGVVAGIILGVISFTVTACAMVDIMNYAYY